MANRRSQNGNGAQATVPDLLDELRTKPARAEQKKIRHKLRTLGHRGGLRSAPAATRLPVLKTYKIFIGGKFPRTESGRSYVLKDATGEPIANICLSSRKDFRES